MPKVGASKIPPHDPRWYQDAVAMAGKVTGRDIDRAVPLADKLPRPGLLPRSFFFLNTSFEYEIPS
jgi:hypothetical protein